MNIFFAAAICFGCAPPPPPPPPPPPASCEGTVSHVSAQSAKLFRKSSASVTFDIADCKADYIFVGPGGRTIFYDDVSGSLTIGFKPSAARLNATNELRLYLASNPKNFANFDLRRREINVSDPGITTGYYFFRRGYVLIPFNQTLFERYERLVLSWNRGSLRKIWVGESVATLQGNLGGSLPDEITLWAVTHKYIRYGTIAHRQKRMNEATGPVVEPIGAFESRNSRSAFTYNYNESVYGNAFSTSIWIGDDDGFGAALVAVTNLQPTTARLRN